MMRKNYAPLLLICMLWLPAGNCGCSMFSKDREPKPAAVTRYRPQLCFTTPTISYNAGTGIPEAFSPFDLDESSLTSDDFLPLSLEDCIHQALTSSKVMRTLGGAIIQSPQSVTSTFDPAITYTNPLAGEEAALSAYDANFFANSIMERNNRRLNNQFFGNNGLFEQYLSTSQVGLSKRSATGGSFNLRNVTIADNNNQLSNALGRQSWESFFEAEMRQPVLRGAGTEFNRIAGANPLPGQLNGVLLSRTRTDVSLVDFSSAVRNLVADVENSYWDLYFAYRDLEAKINVRDIAESTLEQVSNRQEQAANVAQAEEQLHRFQSEVVNSLNGRSLDGTRTNNGSSGGTFRGTGGVRFAERKLRLMIGMPINDRRLIQPSDTPTEAPIIFDWDSAAAEALMRREELRRQRWVIKQRELELIANRNFLKPQLDLIGRYRYRGFGDSLYGKALNESFYDGELQEWQLGLEYEVPVGFRRAHAAVRNSELALVRETEVLREQERNVHFGLSNAMNEAKRAFETRDLQRKRLDAIVRQLNALENKSKANEKPELDVLLETHRRLLDARLQFHQAEVEYALSLRNVHYEKGSLLEYNNIRLVESVSTAEAQQDASQRIQFQDPSAQPLVRDLILAN